MGSIRVQKWELSANRPLSIVTQSPLRNLQSDWDPLLLEASTTFRLLWRPVLPLHFLWRCSPLAIHCGQVWGSAVSLSLAYRCRERNLGLSQSELWRRSFVLVATCDDTDLGISTIIWKRSEVQEWARSLSLASIGSTELLRHMDSPLRDECRGACAGKMPDMIDSNSVKVCKLIVADWYHFRRGTPSIARPIRWTLTAT